MDPLDLLSDDGESEVAAGESSNRDDASGEEHDERSRDSKRLRTDPVVDFDELQRAGYKPAELLETAEYLRDAESQEERRVKSPPPCQLQAEDQLTEEATCKPPPAPPPPVEVCGSGVLPAPWKSFGGGAKGDGIDGDVHQVRFPPEIQGPLLAAGFQEPSPIQSHAWPILGMGRDLIGVAQTGSGKTLGYLLPCFAQLWRVESIGSPAILVLAPTRELVGQIEREAERFRKSTGIVVAHVYGGEPKNMQLAGLRHNPHLVVATPGRLNDFLETEGSILSLRHVRFLVFDEADRMLDDGFEPQIRLIVREASSPRRQTMMFSATWPLPVQKLAQEFLTDAVEIRIGRVDALSANADVCQEVQICRDEAEKQRALVSLLRLKAHSRTIVFVATKRSCRELARSLRRSISGWIEALHGDRTQAEREAALQAFRDGKARVLFATDVAGRGLDVRGVTLVVNFDPPQSAEDYVHRIGRTGRAGDTGLAVSLLTWRDSTAGRYIKDVMEQTGQHVPPELERFVGPSLVCDNPKASRTAVLSMH
eukprot:TRINITY_DN24109_c0_g1_i1.p1 TRINITY_DN24109_c0_g1~~TRINITY_DN24109_c0_g1_i1.p1  ORF type:complete len:538 (+),score=74.55 TRINITY_DN24109_c0_g1_i1:73-1686(+)